MASLDCDYNYVGIFVRRDTAEEFMVAGLVLHLLDLGSVQMNIHPHTTTHPSSGGGTYGDSLHRDRFIVPAISVSPEAMEEIVRRKLAGYLGIDTAALQTRRFDMAPRAKPPVR